MSEPYTTSVYPYSAAMWDEAHKHLDTNPGWSVVLLTCPDPAACEVMAVEEMQARGRTANALVYAEPFSKTHILRVSPRAHLEPEWDDLADQFTAGRTVVLMVDDRPDAVVIMDEVRGAMTERGWNVGIGHSTDRETGMSLIRVERAP